MELNQLNFALITPKPDRYYCVKWFGPLSFFDGHRHRATPFITIAVAELNKLPELGQSLDVSNFVSVEVPVRLLSFIELGDIWCNGRVFRRNNQIFSSAVFSNVSCKPANVKTTSFSAYPNAPLSITRHHERCVTPFTRNYFTQLTASDDTVILIPHIVLLQSFFNTDSYVFESCFKPGATIDSLINLSKSSYDRHTERARIVLRRQVRDVSAVLAAFVFLKESYANAFTKSGSSLAFMHSDPSQPTLTPCTSLPISGYRKLSVVGRHTHSTSAKRYFIVYAISSVDEPIPFKYLSYFRDNPGDLEKGAKPINERDGYRRHIAEPDKNKSLLPDSALDQDPTIESIIGVKRARLKFDGDDAIGIEKLRIEPHKNDAITPSRPVHLSVDTVAIGGAVSGGSAGLEIANVDSSAALKDENKIDKRTKYPQPICRLTLFINFLDYLKHHQKIKSYTPAFNDTLFTVFSPTTLKTRDSTWDDIAYFKGMKRNTMSYRPTPRKIAGVRVNTISGACFYLFEVERRLKQKGDYFYEVDNLPLLKVTQPHISDWEISRLLEHTVRHSGWRPLFFKNSSLIRHPPLHLDEMSSYFEGLENDII